MKILLSHPKALDEEAERINALMVSSDWDTFHLRKPTWKRGRYMELLEKLHAEVRCKVVVHNFYDLVEVYSLRGGHFRYNEFKLLSSSSKLQAYSVSCHTLEEVRELDKWAIKKGKLTYCFLSPIYDSISKPGYRSMFEKEMLRTFLQQKRNIKIIGLGGVTNDNYPELINLGFDGAAFLGSVWNER